MNDQAISSVYYPQYMGGAGRFPTRHYLYLSYTQLSFKLHHILFIYCINFNGVEHSLSKIFYSVTPTYVPQGIQHLPKQSAVAYLAISS